MFDFLKKRGDRPKKPTRWGEPDEGYFITKSCATCGVCVTVCAAGCIQNGLPFHIDQYRCTRCGRCHDICPAGAIKRCGTAPEDDSELTQQPM